MASSFSVNKGLEEPASGDYVNAWATPVNANWTAIDTALGGTTSISVTGVSAPTTTLTLIQYRPQNIEFTGLLSANLTYQIPTGVGGMWSISNATTGSFALSFAISGGNSLVLIAGRTLIVSDGATVSFATGQLNAATIATLLNGVITQPILASYDLTDAEISAGVTPVNYTYPPLYVDRYGHNIAPGSTPMTAAFQAAINVAKISARTVKYGATWPYLLTAALDLTTSPGQIPTANGFTIHCDAQAVATTTNQPYCPSIIAAHTGHIFDCTGTYGLNFENVTVTTSTTTIPVSCFFLARNTDGNSQIVRMTNCRVYGFFSQSLFYNFGSEDFVAVGCYFYNANSASGVKTVTITSHNILGLTSSFQTLATSASCIDHLFVGCQFGNAAPSADLIYLEGVGTPRFIGCWGYMSVGRSMFFVDGTVAPTQNLIIRDWLTESISGQQNLINVSNNSQIHSGWKIDNVTSYSSNPWFISGPLVTIDEMDLPQIEDVTNHGLVISGKLQNSVLYYFGSMTITTSIGNELHGDPTKWTITTRTVDKWYEWSASAGTWTPNTAAMSIIGSLTLSSKRLAYEGAMITATVQMAATGSISCAAGTALGGLPIAAVANSADVLVTNTSTAVGFPGGFVNGANIILPAINVGANVPIIITVRYFAA